MSEQEVTLESLAQRVEQLEKRCENVADCILDSHEEFRKMAEQINTFRKEVHEASNEAANQIIPSVLNQANRVLEEAEAKIREIAAATENALSPEKLIEATANVTPDKIAESLSKKVLVTRPATREEIKAGVGVATRQVTRAEQQQQQ